MRGCFYALVCSLAFAGCNRGASSSRSSACDDGRIKEGIQQLSEAQPVIKPLVAAQTIEAACPTTPDTLRAFLDLVQATVRGTRPMAAVRPTDEERDRLFAAACPIDEAARKKALASPPDQLAETVFAACEFGRYEVIEREAVNAFYGGTPAVWSLHAWMLEAGVTEADARSLSAALLFFEPWHLNRVGLRPGSVLPRAKDAEPVSPSAEVLYVGPDVVAYRGEILAELGDRYQPAAVEDAVTRALRVIGSDRLATVVIVADAAMRPGDLAPVLTAAGWSEGVARLSFAVLRDSDTAPYGMLGFRWDATPEPDDPQPRVSLAAFDTVEEMVQRMVDVGEVVALVP